MALGSAQTSANIPYDAMARQMGIIQGMGMRGPVYQGAAQQPGFLERSLGRVSQFMSAYPFMRDQGMFGGGADKGLKSLTSQGGTADSWVGGA